MKRVFKTMSAVLLAAACSVPGFAWAADGVSMALEQGGELKASDAAEVRSALVEIAFSGEEAAKITDVVLKDAPNGALFSATYSAADKKATVAISAGRDSLVQDGLAIGKLDVIAQGASEEHPVSVDARIVSFEFIDDADSATETKQGAVNPDDIVRLTSTEGPAADDGQGGITDPGEDDDGTNQGGDANGGSATDGSSVKPGTTTADLRPHGVVSTVRVGQSTADASAAMVRTGDMMSICVLVLVASAAVVLVAMGLVRKRERDDE